MDKIVNYFKDAMSEVKKVTWPTKKETAQYATLVIVLSLALALFLGTVDSVLTQLLEKFILN